MAMLRNRRQDEIDPFSDLLFNTLLAFVMLFAAALVVMNPKAKTGVIDAKAEFIITVTWPDFDPNDIDTWVQDPGGNLVWFRAREAGLMHLDRDDRGVANDTIIVNGQTVVNPLNQEVVTIRGYAPGEYTVNLHGRALRLGQPSCQRKTGARAAGVQAGLQQGPARAARRRHEEGATRRQPDGHGGAEDRAERFFMVAAGIG
jgi:hypothetical protein